MPPGYDPARHHRRSIRLKGYDYTQAGAYFVTLCVANKECWLGEIVDGDMHLNEYGQIVETSWAWLAQQYPYVELDEWIVMPNHLHGIIVINDDDNRGGDSRRGDSRRGDSRRGDSRIAPTTKRKPLGRLMGAFKTVSTKRINELRGAPAVLFWQRNYYEHIIRNENALARIRRYIAGNPLQWEMDRENLGCG